jgi:hypothetical protein
VCPAINAQHYDGCRKWQRCWLLVLMALMVRDDEPDWYGIGLVAAASLGWVLNGRNQKLV